MAGYSGTPLAQKLGYKTGVRVWIQAMPPDYRDWLAPLPQGVVFQRRAGADTALHHLFLSRRAQLERSLRLRRASMRPDAMIWVSWPKKASGLASEIGEDDIRAVALPLGLVDVKVCAVSEVWSGLKLVLRKEARPGSHQSK